MSETKRKRGRPTGSEIDDSHVLSVIADLIVADKALPPTTAYKRADPCWTDSSVRRIQDKWKMRREALLAEANLRRDEKRNRDNTEASASVKVGWRYLDRQTADGPLEQLQRLNQSPAMLAIKAAQSTPFALAMKTSEFSSLGQILRATQNSQVSILMNAMKNDPVYRLMKEQRRMRELLNPFRSHL